LNLFFGGDAAAAASVPGALRGTTAGAASGVAALDAEASVEANAAVAFTLSLSLLSMGATCAPASEASLDALLAFNFVTNFMAESTRASVGFGGGPVKSPVIIVVRRLELRTEGDGGVGGTSSATMASCCGTYDFEYHTNCGCLWLMIVEKSDSLTICSKGCHHTDILTRIFCECNSC